MTTWIKVKKIDNENYINLPDLLKYIDKVEDDLILPDMQIVCKHFRNILSAINENRLEQYLSNILNVGEV
jgi:hypothetical protein